MAQKRAKPIENSENLETPAPLIPRDRIISLSRDISDIMYHPIDTSVLAKVATYLLADIPSVKQFPNLSFISLTGILKKFNFRLLTKDEIFKKETKNYIQSSNIFINYENGVIILCNLGDELDDSILNRIFSQIEIYDTLASQVKGLESEDVLTLISIFYRQDRETWLKAFFGEIERIAELDLKVKVKKNHISFLCYDHSYRLKNIKMGRKVDVNLELNYGPGFPLIYDKLIKFLHSDESGLCILNGEPGSGKTFFIRYLLSVLDKKVIYVPPNLIGRIAEPDFLNFMLSQNDFILVIEDAEEAVTDRTDTNNVSAVSNLLNLSDGILGDCIKSRILVTFNAEIKNIDPALLRKGRLKLQYQFGPLPVEESNKLLKHLKINYETKEPMLLSDIYNKDYDNLRKEKAVAGIGFSVK